jgi:hypothetical protein
MEPLIVFHSCPCGNTDPSRYQRIVVDKIVCPITLWVQCLCCGRNLPARDEEIVDAQG